MRDRKCRPSYSRRSEMLSAAGFISRLMYGAAVRYGWRGEGTMAMVEARFGRNAAGGMAKDGTRGDRRRVLCRAKRSKSRNAKKQKERPSEDVIPRKVLMDDAQEEAVEERVAVEKKEGWSFFPPDEEREEYERAIEEEMGEEVPYIDMTNPSSPSEGPLPELTREQVLQSCLYVSGGIFAMSLFLRAVAPRSIAVLGSDPDVVRSLLAWNPPFKADDAAVAVAAASLVSVARFVLYENWRDFTVATDLSNGQVLKPLNFVDICVVSFVPGIAEEMLFRGGLVPAMFADWRGVLISGVVFGALHRGGGRNVAFAVWASAVGCLYGFAFLLTQNIYVPIVAHSTANLFSAMKWLSLQEEE